MPEIKRLFLFKTLIPENLDFEKILESDPPTFKYRKEFFYYLIHLIWDIPARNDELKDFEFTPLYSKLLQNKQHDDYRDYLDYLVAQKIFETDNYYIPGKKSRGFKIGKEYENRPLKEVRTPIPFRSNLCSWDGNVDFDAKKKYPYLEKWFNDKLEIDVQGAIEYLEQEYNLIQFPTPSDYRKHQRNLSKIYRIKNGQYWFTVDDKGHRLHTNFTSLNKTMKRFITYNGQPLVSIDVVNSQPLGTLKFLGQTFPFILQTHHNSYINTIQPHKTLLPYTVMLEDRSETLDFTDVSRYVYLVANGRLYEYLIEAAEREFGADYFKPQHRMDMKTGKKKWDTSEPRRVIKTFFYEVAYSRNSPIDRKEKKLFRKLFPNVLRAFEDIKKRRHYDLARKLQRLEAKMILDKACKEISQKWPHIPLFTIHDSIVTTVGYEHIIREVMDKVIFEEIGFHPQLKPEYWCYDCQELKQAA